MNGKTKNLCSLIVMALFANNVGAELLMRDWVLPGDGAITWDTTTGLEWLDITETVNLSFNQVSAQLGAGGVYGGFGFASRQQILGLFASSGLVEMPGGVSAEGQKIAGLLDFWGVAWDLGTGERTEFLTIENTGLNPGEHWSGRVYWFENGMTGVDAQMYIHPDDFYASGIGSALVRPAVPVTTDGDVNENGGIDVGDLLLVLRVVLGNPVPPGIELGRADLYPPGAPDGIINLSDFILLKRMIL